MRRRALYVLLSVTMLAAYARAEPLVLEVAHVSVAFDQKSGQPFVIIRLSVPSERLFADFTTRNLNKKVEFRVNGRTVDAPYIRESIIGGVVHLAPETEAEARDLARRLASGATIEVEPASD